MDNMAFKVFISYSHQDQAYLRELDKHLSNLKRQQIITSWYDGNISPGTDWKSQIKEQLRFAQIILLLVSADFMDSDFCYSIEMTEAIARHNANQARVIPIILRPTDWKGAPFAKLKFLPTDGKAITKWSTHDDAFEDIVQGIRAAIDDLNERENTKPFTDPSMGPSEVPLYHVPHSRNVLFTGRDDVLQQLHDRFSTATQIALTQSQAISGLGGIGKTQIAVEYAYRYQSEYSFIFWVRADTPDTLRTDFLMIADLLHLPERGEQDQQIIVTAVKRWLAGHSDWLLIMDNTDDFDLIQDFIPLKSNTNRHVLLTTRSYATSKIAPNITVENMALEEGALLLLRRAGILPSGSPLAEAKASERIKAEAIVRIFDGLPLALDQAGAYIEETGCSLSDYLDLYQKERLILLNERGGFASDHPESVAATFSLAFRKIREIDPIAAEVLRLCAFLHPDQIPEEIFTDYRPIPNIDPDLRSIVASQFELNASIKSLLRYSLIRRNSETKTLTIHRLVQAVLKDEMDDSMQCQWAERTVRYVSRSFPHPNHKSWHLCQRYLPHAYLCAELIEQWKSSSMEAAGLLYRAGEYLYQRAIYSEVNAYYLKALEISEKIQGSEYPGLASILEKLAELNDKQSKFAEAEAYYQKALELRKKVFGLEHYSVADSYNDLASLYRDTGDYIKAEKYYQLALKLRKKLGLKSAKNLNDLAILYKAQGKYAKAEALYKESLASKIEEEDIDLASNLCNLADLYREQGRHTEAEPLSLRALVISEEKQGSEHPDVATKANNLALIYLERGKFAEAEALFLRAIAINDKAFESEYLGTSYTLSNLASLYIRQGKFAEADLLLKRALAISEQVGGSNHPQTATILDNMALSYYFQRRIEEAEPLYKQALTIWDLTRGKEPVKMMYTLRSYAKLLRDTYREFDAKKLEDQAKEINAMLIQNNKEYNKRERTVVATPRGKLQRTKPR